MSIPLKAVYLHGAFVPEQPPDLPEGTRVTLTLQREALVVPPLVTDPEERRRVLKELVEDMAANPVPPNAPRFTRDELHERR